MRIKNILTLAALLMVAATTLAALTPLWRLPAETGVVYTLLKGNELLCVNKSGVVALVSFDKGRPASTITLPAVPVTRPVLSGDALLFAGNDNRVYCASLSDGKALWSATLPARRYSEMAVYGGTVYVGTLADTCGVYGFALSDGHLVFSASVPQPVHVAPLVAFGRVFAATAGGEVYSFDLLTGNRLSILRTQGEFIGQPLLMAGGRLLMAPSLGHRKGECVEPASGKAVWSVSFERPVYADADQLTEYLVLEPREKARLFREYLGKTPVMARVAAEQNAWDAFMSYGSVVTSGWSAYNGEAAVVTSELGWETSAACQLVRVDLASGKVLGQVRRILPGSTATSCVAPVYTYADVLAMLGTRLLTAVNLKSGGLDGEAQLPAYAAGPILSCKAGVAVVTSDGGVSAFRMEEGTAVAGEYGLSQNYPNPFNPATTFNYQVPREGLVLLTVYNIRGQEMIRLVDGMKSAGAHSVVWDGHDANKRVVPSGVYIAIMKSGNFRKVVKMTMLK